MSSIACELCRCRRATQTADSRALHAPIAVCDKCVKGLPGEYLLEPKPTIPEQRTGQWEGKTIQEMIESNPS